MLGVDEPAGGGVNTRGDVFGAAVAGTVVSVPGAGLCVVGVSAGNVGSGVDPPGVVVSGAFVSTEGASVVEGAVVNTGACVDGTGRETPEGGNGAFSDRVTFGAVLASHAPLTDHISVPLKPSLAVKYKMLWWRKKRSGRLPAERLISIDPVPFAALRQLA